MSCTALVSQKARFDVNSIRRYIAQTLKAPITAERVFQKITGMIDSLSEQPERFQLASFDSDTNGTLPQIRRLFVVNYAVYYEVHHEQQEVRVLRVLSTLQSHQTITNKLNGKQTF